MLTQEEFDEEVAERNIEEGEQRTEQERRMMMTTTRMKKRDMKVPKILSHVKPDGG